ncbi:MAG TPA: dihydrofolate reductase family protein [Anaerolineales bacterium]|nr:dihydrofolate reductase family protein [Anaerolineales bacterium]
MRKIVVGTFLTLDGVMQAPGDPQEDTAGGFKQGGWQMPYFDEDAGKIMDQQIAETDALLLGRITYQIFAAYWPFAPADDPFAKKLNSVPKYVVSTTLDNVEWNNSTLIKSNVAEEIAKLKQQPGSGILSVTGSGKLAQTLMRQDLVDEYILWIHPLVLGNGKRLFEGGVIPANLKLVDTKTTRSGVLILTYQPDKK